MAVNIAELDKRYNYKELEEEILKQWLKRKVYDIDFSKEKKYSIVIPPPNVTGSLHIGHALDNTIQDILIRYYRMKGYNTAWFVGVDHAGIATQTKVEKKLLEEGKTKHDLGRQEFLKQVWLWKEKYGETIVKQLQRLGASCLWDKKRFTMDSNYVKAVKKAFVYLYNKGYIYKDKYIINWCPRCHTALSDLEVISKEEEGKLYYLKYMLEDLSDYITIATTRPETILADSAIAVNPLDKRYKKFVGKKVLIPVINKAIPVIEDEHAKMEFGTGAVKITPAHDFDDFEVGKRHNLEKIIVIDSKGYMNENAYQYQGLDRFSCREKIVKDIEKAGLLEKVEDYKVVLGRCYRCNTVLEPYMSMQWFVDMKELKKPAIKVVEDKIIKFYPERFSKMYLEWMYNLRPWCISRQLWWGHRIPVYYCDKCNKEFASEKELKSCPDCNSQLRQDEDVLDTWFSSALWPFAVMGWPDETKELKRFFPTDVLVTGRDIIYLWVARMIMTSLEFMKEIPFKDVYIHATILDKQGRRMSKSLGTGVDPLDLIKDYGADALRLGLIMQTAFNQDVRFTDEKIITARNFANKIWNATRFVLIKTKDLEDINFDIKNLDIFSLWILYKLNDIIENYNRLIKEYNFTKIVDNLFHFFWDDFSNIYIEILKFIDTQDSKKVLLYTLIQLLKLLHPFIPFVTEALWQKGIPEFVKDNEFIMKSLFPNKLSIIEDFKESIYFQVDIFISVLELIRQIRANMKLKKDKKLKIFYKGQNLKTALFTYLSKLTNSDIKELKDSNLNNSIIYVRDLYKLYIVLDKLDMEKEKERLNKQLNNLKKQLEIVEKKLKNEQFLKKAKKEIILQQKQKRESLKKQLEEVNSLILTIK